MENQERIAREWAEDIIERGRGKALWLHDGCLAAAELVLANTKPLTMEGVQWDDDEHYLAGATVAVSQAECVMLSDGENGMIATAPMGGDHVIFATPAKLAPNGKRYELREVTVSSGENVAVDQPEHPQVLRTMADYEDAPTGTIIASVGGEPWLKGISHKHPWSCKYGQLENTKMAFTERVVLRWGWGE